MSVSQGTISFSVTTLLHAVKQSVSWPPIISYLVSFPCIYSRSLALVYTQAHNTYHAFLHTAKYFFKSLYYNFGTLTARSCRIISNCNKVADKNLTQLKILISVSERKHTYQIHVIKHATLHTVTQVNFYQALTLNNATITCEQQGKHKTVCYKNVAKFIEIKFH